MMTMNKNAQEEALAAFTAAYETYANAIFRHCRIRLYDTELAEDIMEDTFIHLWDYMAKGKDIEHMRALLYRIANNLIIDHIRAKKRRPTISINVLEEEGKELGYDPTEEWKADMSKEKALSIIAQLKEPYKTVITLRYVDGLSPAEIAEILGKRANVIWTQLYRGMEYLREILPNKSDEENSI